MKTLPRSSFFTAAIVFPANSAAGTGSAAEDAGCGEDGALTAEEASSFEDGGSDGPGDGWWHPRHRPVRRMHSTAVKARFFMVMPTTFSYNFSGHVDSLPSWSNHTIWWHQSMLSRNCYNTLYAYGYLYQWRYIHFRFDRDSR